MAADFLDTSALSKHYHAEVGTDKIDQLWNNWGHALFISRLSVVEMTSVFARKVREGAISTADFDSLRKRFLADLTKSKRLVGVRMLVGHFQEAERLLRERGTVLRLRTLDALQLAVSLDLFRKKAVERVVSADKDLLTVAEAEGLAVFDPENP
jgi:predicted nucleic acid-binding protein